MIEARDVTFSAGGRDLVVDVSVEFAPGQLHLIVGPNGAGKSTLIKLLSRLLRPRRGQVRYEGRDVASAGEADLARRRAVLSQAIELAFPLSVREVVRMGRYPHFGTRAGPEDETVIAEVMRDLEVDSLADRSYPTLSGGEKQRVNFARVLAQVWRPLPSTTRVLFLDEPLTFLDIGHQLGFLRRIRSFAASSDVVVVGVLHDLNLAARFADRLVLIDQGRVTAAGTRDEVLTAAHIRSAFGVSAVLADAPGIGTQLVFE